MELDLLAQIKYGGILYVLLVIAITMHEFGHAFVADKLGDRLPRLEGRVTINPVAHMDMMGTVILPILTIALSMGSGFPMVFGWGKPVRIMLDNPKTRKKVDILSTAGGLVMNLVVALISAILFAVFAILGWQELASVAFFSVSINCVLFIINLIPVPPLDGAHFLKYAINMSEETYYSISRYGIAILLAIIWIPFTNRILMTIIGALISVFETVSLLIINLFAGK